MSTGLIIGSRSANANSDLSAKRGYCMKYVTNGDTVDVVGAATDPVAGILINDPTQNQTAEIQYAGQAVGVADGSGTAIALNDPVGPNNLGVLVKKATNDYNIIGRSLDACAIAGGVIRVIFTPNAVFRTLAG